jgi:hypothetical protein
MNDFPNADCTSSGHHIRKPNLNVSDARTAAGVIEPLLPPPSAMEKMGEGNTQAAGYMLFKPPVNPIREVPCAVLDQFPLPDVVDVPEAWLPIYQSWCLKRARGPELKHRIATCRRMQREGGGTCGCVPQDAIIAGALLYLLSPRPDSELRARLMAVALTESFGAYMAAEGLTVREEHSALVKSIAPDHRLLYWASLLPGFGSPASKLACGNHDLWSGLILARLAGSEMMEGWLNLLALAACARPAAASAALILQPHAAPQVRRLWLGTLQQPGASMYAYEALRWCRHTGPEENWTPLDASLSPHILADGAAGWFHYLRDVRPDLAQKEMDNAKASPLWLAQLLSECDLNRDRWRYHVGELLGTATVDKETQLLLRFLSSNHSRKILQGAKAATGR